MVSVQFCNDFTGRHFVVDGPKSFKLLADISFESGLQNTVLPSLLLFSWACFYVDLDDIQWNERATSTARNFNNSRPSYLKFSNMINLCTNIWFVENSKCQQFLFWKRKIFQFFKKTTITHFSCFKGSLFCSRWMALLKWMLTSFERLLLAF